MIGTLFGLAFWGFVGTLVCLWGGVLAHSDPECRAIFPAAAVATTVFLTGGLSLTYVRARLDRIEKQLGGFVVSRDD